MGKKSKASHSSGGGSGRGEEKEGGAKKQRPDTIRAAVAKEGDEEGLEFEDQFEDEYEEELYNEEVEDPDDDEDPEEEEQKLSTVMEVDEEPHSQQPATRAFRPGVDELGEGEELQFDPSAYHMYHSLRPEWPCLSFDILKDGRGMNRTRYPHTLLAVAGTQAARGEPNKVQVMKLSDLHRTQKIKNIDEDDEEEEEDDHDDEDVEPTLSHIDVPHKGGVNRIRSMPQQTGIIVTWSDNGSVTIMDINKQIKALETGGARESSAPTRYTFKGHKDEGYAIDWSKVVTGQLASGCCSNKIYIHAAQEGGLWETGQPYLGHTGSVEDIQWSPTENTVFASASADGSISIWDSRKRSGAMLSVPGAHGGQDVNVISWNSGVTYLLASGGDDGVLRTWDLRAFGKGSPEPVAKFAWHSKQITSIEWHPTDESMLAVCGADDQVTVWDLSVEADEGDLLGDGGREGLNALPPQLLFTHQGQKDIKEVHFHPQIPGVLMTTALDGFNIWKPAIVLQDMEV